MTPKRRIFFNVLATYGRSLYSLVLGLFAGRWALLALGQVDYGLLGLVGGLTVFISFFNTVLASSVSRFYAYSVGQTLVKGNESAGLEECRRWFNVALFIHTLVPCILISVGYPVGIWAVKSFLSIPPERIDSCVWVFRFVCVSCFIGMVNVPFSAMYTAKQYIAELTIYGVISSTCNVAVLYYMITHPSDWLTKYSACQCAIAVVPQLIIAARAMVVFPECKLRFCYMVSISRFKQLLGYSGWQMFGSLGWMFQSQGMSVLVNKYFGAAYNASLTVSSTVNGHANSLTGALVGAFVPAITQSCGAGRRVEMVSMSYRADKFSLILSLMFFLPLSVELKNIMQIWLVNPPPAAVGLCLIAMVGIVANNSTIGFMSAIMANGRIGLYQLTLGSVLILSLPAAWLVCATGANIYWAVAVATSAVLVHAFMRAVFAKWLLKMSIRKWFFGIVMPVSIAIVVSVSIGCLPILVWSLPASFARVVMTTFFVEAAFLPMTWYFVLDNSERGFVLTKLKAISTRINGIRK